MAIDQAVIDQAKHTDLVALVQAKGIELKKNGKSYFGLWTMRGPCALN